MQSELLGSVNAEILLPYVITSQQTTTPMKFAKYLKQVIYLVALRWSSQSSIFSLQSKSHKRAQAQLCTMLFLSYSSFCLAVSRHGS